VAEAHARASEVVKRLAPRPLMRLELVHDVPYTAYCDYFTNTMRLNADQPFTAERLKLLDDYGLHGYFDGGLHSGLVLLLLKIGAKADASLSAKFKYLNLTADAALSAGADGNYALIRSFPGNMPAVDLLKNFLGSLRLPANINGPLNPD